MASDYSGIYVNQYDERQSYNILKANPGSIRGFESPDGWIIGRALVTEVVIYEDYEFATAFAAGGSANSGQGPIQIQDSSSREIIYHEREGELWEVFQGYTAGHLRIFMETNGQHSGNLQKDLGPWTVSSTAGSVFGFVMEGWESLYKQETGRGRFLLPPFQRVRYYIYNPSGQSFTLASRYIFNKMQFAPFNPKNRDELKLMVDILRGKIRKDVWLYTPGMELYPFKGKDIRKVYRVEPLKWDGVRAGIGEETVFGPETESEGGD